jgi:hypothetical protein
MTGTKPKKLPTIEYADSRGVRECEGSFIPPLHVEAAALCLGGVENGLDPLPQTRPDPERIAGVERRPGIAGGGDLAPRPAADRRWDTLDAEPVATATPRSAPRRSRSARRYQSRRG